MKKLVGLWSWSNSIWINPIQISCYLIHCTILLNGEIALVINQRAHFKGGDMLCHFKGKMVNMVAINILVEIVHVLKSELDVQNQTILRVIKRVFVEFSSSHHSFLVLIPNLSKCSSEMKFVSKYFLHITQSRGSLYFFILHEQIEHVLPKGFLYGLPC